MNRYLALGVGLVAVGVGRAADPAPSPWRPPATVWTTPTAVKQAQATTPAPTPAAPAPMPGVPAPGTPTPAASTPAASVVVPPAMTAPPAPMYGSVTDPLPAMLGTLPTTPTVPLAVCAGGGCGAAGCPAAGPALAARRVGNGSFLSCFGRWVCFQPGPPVLPCEANRYHAPVRSFFPCVSGPGGSCAPGGHPGGGHAAGGPAAGCAAGNCATGACGDSLLGGACAAPKHKGLGAFSRPSQSAPTTGPTEAVTQAIGVPLPAACIGTGPGYAGSFAGCGTIGHACRTGAGGSLLDRAFNRLTPVPGLAEAAPVMAAPTTVVPTVVGYTRPAAPGYRFADPLNPPQVNQTSAAPPRPAPAVQPAGHTRPFTRP